MNKTLIAILAGATMMTSVAHAELYNTFIGTKDNGRTITNTVTDGNVTTFTVDTLRKNGTIRTRTFTATNIDGEFTVSGNGKAAFKEFLTAHAMEAQNISTEVTLTKNEIAFNAYTNNFGLNLEYNTQNQNKDFVDLTEKLNITVDYSAVEPAEAPSMTNEEAYIAFNENRGNSVYTPYKYVSSIDWITMYNNEVASDEATNTVDADAYNSVVQESVESVEERNAAYEAEQARIREEERFRLYGSESTRLADQANRDISDKSVIGVADFATYQDIDYNRVDVRGLEQAHNAGWTGKGIVIGVKDTAGYRDHGDYVARAVLDVAPGATVNHREEHRYDRSFRNVDIVNHSGGAYVDMLGGKWNPADIEELTTHALPFNLGLSRDNPDALIVTSHANTTVCRDLAVEDCSAQVRAHNTDRLEGDWIFVRSSGQYESHAAGNSDIKNHTLTAHGITTNGWIGGGNSFAAPKVAGAAALLMHKYPNLNSGEVKNVLLESAFKDFDGYSLDYHGRGILDVGAALSPIGTIN